MSRNQHKKKDKLSQLKPGDKARIERIEKLPFFLVYRMQSLGIFEGREVYLKRNHPEFLIRVGYTMIAINYHIASKVTVSKLPPSSIIG